MPRIILGPGSRKMISAASASAQRAMSACVTQRAPQSSPLLNVSAAAPPCRTYQHVALRVQHCSFSRSASRVNCSSSDSSSAAADKSQVSPRVFCIRGRTCGRVYARRYAAARAAAYTAYTRRRVSARILRKVRVGTYGRVKGTGIVRGLRRARPIYLVAAYLLVRYAAARHSALHPNWYTHDLS